MQPINLLIPPVCNACHQRLDDPDALLCPSCQSKIRLISGSLCPKCGSLLQEGSCEACAQISYDFDAARAVYQYEEPISGIIHNLKYRSYTKGADLLARGIAEYIQANPEFQKVDYISAVPLHTVRKRERGYNQSELIAKKAAALSGLKYIKAVVRKRYTQSQTHLHREQRLQNLNSAFRACKPAQLAGKSIIVIDDVFTTGSTINEISKTLHAAGVNKVFGIAASRA